MSWEETGVHDWTKEEIEVLKNNWQLTDEELHKLLPRHTTVSIAYKRRKLGLYKKERQPISQRKWTKEEVEYLRKNFKYKRINELAKELGRSTHSVHNKTFRLGLRKKRKKGVLYGWE